MPAADAAGYAELQLWAERLGGTEEIVFGIEGAGGSAPTSAGIYGWPGTGSSRSNGHVEPTPHNLDRPGQVPARARAYLDRRIREGKSKREALRYLKRNISRELYHHLRAVPLTS